MLIFTSILIALALSLFCKKLHASEITSTNWSSKYNHTYYSIYNSKLIWQRLSSNFRLPHHSDNPLVKKYIDIYVKEPHRLYNFFSRSMPYLFHIVKEIETRENLPGELALLPIIESGFKPLAKSSVGARGLWQINDITSKHLDLQKDRWFDAAHDIIHSTSAALDYLKELNVRYFNNDWMLTLAAYNFGSAKIKKAIRHNQKNQKKTDYWSLRLPKETKNFIPKLLAISHIVVNLDRYNIALPDIENEPYFTTVDVGTQIDLKLAANLSGISLKEVRLLNPGYIKHLTHPEGPHLLLLPVKNAQRFHQNLDKIFNKQKTKNFAFKQYKIKPGDSLSVIARRNKTSISTLKFINQLSNDKIVVGRSIIIPRS